MLVMTVKIQETFEAESRLDRPRYVNGGDADVDLTIFGVRFLVLLAVLIDL